MKVLILSGNPKTEGLCQSVIEQVKAGAAEGGAQVEEIRLSDMTIGRCHVCGNGWGTCRSTHICAFGDDGFDEVVERIREADAVVLATPVYWGETAESLKSFIDRFRRCQFGQEGVLSGKQVLLVASPGGSGNGLEQLDRFCRHTGAIIFDYIGINRWNSDYKRIAARSAAKALAGGRKNGETV
jgi:multimeric flavodoxin WrbA